MSLHNCKTSLFLGLVLISGMVGTTFAQDNQPVYDDISADIADIRELELLEPIDVEVMSREQLREETRSDLETDYPEDERLADQRVLVAFGLIDSDENLGNVYVDLLGEQIAGYYDPQSNEMVVVASNESGELSASDKVTFAHETVHALQDQHFNLETYTDMRMEGTSDESLAITSLIEGDATLAQIDYILSDVSLARDFLSELEDGGNDSSEALDNAPAILSATLLFPYEQGLTFVQFLHEEGGWEMVDAAFENPPMTTEQILHPEKYIEGEEAIEVEIIDVAATLGSGWSTMDEDSMGEFQISIVLGESELSEKQIERASEGWGGDSYVVCGTDEDVVIVWRTAWDSEDDAEEFAKALTIREGNRLDAELSESEDGTLLEGDDAQVLIVSDGSSVTYIQSPNSTLLDTVTDALDYPR